MLHSSTYSRKPVRSSAGLDEGENTRGHDVNNFTSPQRRIFAPPNFQSSPTYQHLQRKFSTAKMFFTVFVTFLTLLHHILAAPTCTTLSIPVSISARNAHFPPDFTTTSLLSIVGALGAVIFDSLITDTYTIVGTYCEPEVLVESRRETVQLLVHGATYTRSCQF